MMPFRLQPRYNCSLWKSVAGNRFSFTLPFFRSHASLLLAHSPALIDTLHCLALPGTALHYVALRCTTLLRTVVHAHLYLTLLLPASPFARMRAVTLHLLVRCDRWVFTSSCFLHYFHLPFSRFRVLLPAPFSAARCAGGQCVLSFCGVEYEVLWFFRSSPSLLRRGVLCRGILFHPRSSCFTHALSHFASPTVFAV